MGLMEYHVQNVCFISCPDCKEEILGKALDHHRNKECKEFEIQCEVHGCDFKTKRMWMDAHLREKKDKHELLKKVM